MRRSLGARKEIARASERQRPVFETVGEDATWQLMTHRGRQQRIRGGSEALTTAGQGDGGGAVAAAVLGRRM